MFEWLKNVYFREDGFEGEVKGFNKKTNKLIVNGEDNEGNESIIEKDLFTGEIEHNIDCYEDWQKKLFQALQRENRVYINVYSTEKIHAIVGF